MPNLDDFDLRPGDPGNPRRPPPDPLDEPLLKPRGAAPAAEEEVPADEPFAYESMERRAGPKGRAVGLIVALILAAGLVAAFWVMSRRVDAPAAGAVADQPAPSAPSAAADDEPARTSELEAPLPPLDQSDALVRELVGGLSRHPALTAWLATGNLVRTFAAAVENASLGASPAANLRFLAPREPYRVLEGSGVDEGEITPDPLNYQRFNLVTEVFTSIDPQAAGDAYRRLDALVQEAFAELGYPDQRFESALAAAIETLVATPIPERAPALERHVNTYRYADPRLEELAPVQKQLLRMGPENARRIRAHLRRIATELELGID